ncbi:ATP-binding protein [Candidatus Thiosymbion oneisti]|uniref:ATP-binding protein n=1 Tax=Candidatus Thiosymbion oneisti TaxID=589554 RepID=UPI000B7DAAD0|nr:ATP-binding protein [Candidatus Thiosymbion oneisti]
MYLKRSAETALREIISGDKVGVVLGARQVGKTTLVQHVVRKRGAVFLNFDVEVDKARFQAAATLPPTDALGSLGDPRVLVIDEAQRLPEASRIIKGWHDTHLPVKILLLGSSALNLRDQAAESLTGRNRKLILPPLLFSETLSAQAWATSQIPRDQLLRHFAPQLRASLQQRLAFGAYPEVVLTPDPVRLLRELSADYLWKDVLQTGLIKTPDLIKRLLLLLAHQVGSEVSVNELATQLGMARPTVERYLDLLEQTFVIFRLPSFSTNPRKEIAKGRKIFFWDTGIRNALLNAFATEALRPDIGPLWENWTIAEIAKRNALLGAPAELFFWRSRTQSEVDLVVKQGDRLRAFEIKWSGRRTRNRAFRDAYGVHVETIGPENPFVADRLEA